VVELDGTKRSRFATTAHVIQLKSWKLCDEAESEIEAERGIEGGKNLNEDGDMGHGREVV